MNQKKLIGLALFAAASFAILLALDSGSAHAEQKLSPAVLKECEKLYVQYRELGEADFRAKYSHKAYLNDCIKLYKDPNWTFAGKEKIDNYFDKIDAVKSKKLSTSDIKSVKILQKLKIGKERFYVKFQACASDVGIANPTFLIQTDLEKFLAKSSKILPANKCLAYTTDTGAKYSDAIGVKFVNDGPLYQGLKVKAI